MGGSCRTGTSYQTQNLDCNNPLPKYGGKACSPATPLPLLPGSSSKVGATTVVGSSITATSAQIKRACKQVACCPGYYADGDSCKPYGGSCANGELAPQAQRTQHDHCARCTKGYGLNGKKCDPCVYKSTFSDMFDARACTPLDTCQPPSDWNKGGEYEAVPPAKDATADRTCATHAPQCTDAEWQKQAPTATSDRLCESAGSCPNGALVPLRERTQANHCGSCNPGYYLENKQCKPYEGSCANGSLKPQGERTKHNECGTCNTGYKMKLPEPYVWEKILDHNLGGYKGLSRSGQDLYDNGYDRLKIQAGSRVHLFESNSYDLRGLDNTCGSCNCGGNGLGHGLYWHGGRGGCYGSSHYGLATTGDVHISCGGSSNSWWGHFHRSGVDTGVYGFGRNNCINENEWHENFKLFAGKKQAQEYYCKKDEPIWTKILDHNLGGYRGLSRSGHDLYNHGYKWLKIQAGSRVQIFDSVAYDLRGLDNTCGHCNCGGNGLGHGLYWHGGRGGCYGSSHYGLATTSDVHISWGGSSNSWWGHFHRSGVDTGVYGFGRNNCINENEWHENFKLFAGKKQAQEYY